MDKNSGFVFKRLLRDDRGTTAILFGLIALPLFGMIGLSVDYGMAIHSKTKLQSLVDAAAIAGARLPATANTNRYNAAHHMLSATIAQSEVASATTEIDASNAEVKIAAAYEQPTIVLGLFGVNTIKVKANASARSQIENGGVVCLLALNPTSDDGLHLQGINKSASKNCWGWVNSDSSTSINAVGTSSATAQGFCTVGNVSGGEHFAPTPFSGCEPMSDPFADKFASYYPHGDWCTATDLELKNGSYTLNPGVYCGGITLKPQADVTFRPGIYVIRNGTFEIQGGASANGEGVAFFFSGQNSPLIVRGGGNIDFKAPTDGDAAGFLFVDRTTPWNSTVYDAIVQGGGRVKMEGILYAPQWRLNIGGNGDLNQESKFFAMIADSFYMEGNGKLYINPDAAEAGLPDLMPKIKNGPVITQ